MNIPLFYLNFQSPNSPAICNLRVNQQNNLAGWCFCFLRHYARPQGSFYSGCDCEIETFEKLLVTHAERERELFFCIARGKGATHPPRGLCVCPWSTGDLCFLLLACGFCQWESNTKWRGHTAAAAERGPRIKRHIHLCV